MTTTPEAKGPKVPPSFPPRTPPPQKRPTEAPRPRPTTNAHGVVGVRQRPRMEIRNRQTAGLTFRADRWAAQKAAAQVVARVRAWGYGSFDEPDLAAAVSLLVGAAVTDGGKRVSLHLADQDQRILVVALSHRPGLAPEDDVLAELAAVRTVESCGTDTAPDGRRVWALLDAAPEPRRKDGPAAV
ncbi:hypothetical protein [Streptomyces sp. NPDC059990]|uniref:hypothetical protein n=2 Tax=unclassified Streptomyces TaxID=2593676 RepID=UPI0036A6483A